MRIDRKTLIIFAGVLVLELLLAIFLTPSSHWDTREEEHRSRHAESLYKDIGNFFLENEGDPSYVWLPAFQLLMAAIGRLYWLLTFGQKPADFIIIGRGLTAVFTALVCVYTFQLSKSVFGNRNRLNPIAGILPFFSGYALSSGSIAFPDMLIVLMVVSMVYHAFRRFIQRSEHPGHLIVLILAVCLGMMGAYEVWPMMAVFVAFLAYHEYYYYKERLNEIIALACVTGSIAGIWTLYNFQFSGSFIGWRQWYFENGYAHDIQFLPAISVLYERILLGIGFTAIAILIYPLVFLKEHKKERTPVYFFIILVSLITSAFLIFVSTSTVTGIWYLPRAFLIFLPFSALFSVQLAQHENIYLRALGLMIIVGTIPFALNTFLNIRDFH